MGSNIETLFDPAGILNNERTSQLVRALVEGVPPESKVLSVGCTTSLPILSLLSSASHHIYGIDGSQKTLDFAQTQVSGQFEQAPAVEYLPQSSFDVILGIFSLHEMNRAQVRSLVFKMGDWLKPGGFILLATSPIDYLDTESRHNIVDDCIRDYPLNLFGNSVHSTLFSRNEWISMFEKAGVSLDNEAYLTVSATADRPSQHHSFMSFRKSVKHSILGPYPLPEEYRGPIPLSEAAWKPFVDRLVRDEFDFVLQVLESNQQVLDVGSGYGKLPIEVAARTGKAYSIEPNADRNSIQTANARDRGVEIAQGSAENIPYPDAHFDAVVAMWVMHYVQDLEKSLREIVRVTDRSAPNSRIVIVQGAPDNEIIDLMNTVCAPLSASNPLPNHQGYLLHKAAEVFAACEFGNITFHRVDAYCEFTEQDLSDRCEQAAGVIAGLWCLDDSNFNGMKQALIPRLRFHFLDRPHAIGDQVAVLVARPSEDV
ncbi:putative 2-heptaprenyl-1,4-naphthoquinone methyltransferase [Aspergillus steynii IBT 23096]|uniref:Putative 2-heptaprenyl-1,4-naphthoquinone methyltransferase n=1 Tax=Aspergillus steynii IBT 23096 TaxID=1392250 RepID=A0A2I2G124_9EURO|nr:putative 2-heptaprenyl-1,4-naphthoquinone methyltransferase [Aspergillus steynii IBT 23096]PLB46582.1 putative 2-heptaprenyl-1,4-naphthoquinone methyltransferase [Aspergillus steynii IBT 23096]